MGDNRRINVNSGRQLEQLAHYSRALRVGDTVLQSGTTAIDKQGNVIGEGSVAKQVDAIVDIAQASMGRANGNLEDIVRSRVYVTDIALADATVRALHRHFRDVCPATTLVEVNALARPTQLIEIEFDAVDGAKQRAERFASDEAAANGYAEAVRIDDRIHVGALTASNDNTGDMVTQARNRWQNIARWIEQAGGEIADVVYTKTFLTDLANSAQQIQARLEMLGNTTPVETLLGVPSLANGQVEIEVEAVVGAARERRDFYTEQQREKVTGYSRAVEVGERVYVSGCTATDASGAVGDVGDWAAQYDHCHRNIERALAQAGAELGDVIRRRIFTVIGAQQNRPHGEGTAWFKDSRPVSLGCRINGLAHPDMLVEIDAVAIKGAHRNIEWLEQS